MESSCARGGDLVKWARSIVCVLALAGALPACGGGSGRPGDAAAGGGGGNDAAAADHPTADAPADQNGGTDLGPDVGGDTPAGGDGSLDVGGDVVGDAIPDVAS